MTLLLVFVSFLLFTHIYADCQNPLFQDYIQMPSKQQILIPLLTQPQTQTSFGSCSHFDGRSSCCNADSFSQIIRDMDAFDQALEIEITALQALRPEDIVNQVLTCYNWSINSRQFNYAVQIATIVKSLFHPALQCYGGMLGYFQGMLCFSCEPNWNTYYNALQEVLTLSQDTCNGVYQVCQSLENSLQNALLQSIPLLIQILQADDNPNCCYLQIMVLTTFLNALKQESICEFAAHKSCQDLLCQDLLRGLNYGPDYNRTDDECVNYNVHNFQTGSPIVMNNLLGMVSKLKQQTLKAPVGYVKNVYTSQGFDAYNIGCSPSLSSYACPPTSSSSTGWKLVVIIGGSVIGGIVLAAVVIICRRKRAAEAVALDDNLPTSAALEENLPKYNRLEGGVAETHEGGVIQ